MAVTDRVEGYLEVGTNGRGEVVLNIPKVKTDSNGAGHVVFSPRQAKALAGVLQKKAAAAKAEEEACHDFAVR